MESTTKIDLFGGAMTAMCPTGFFSDISNFRQVPDNQEVFVSTKPPNIALIVELLDSSSVAGLSDEDALTFYFTDLASLNNSRQNDASSTGVALSCENLSSLATNFAIPSIDSSVGRFGLIGVQTVRKGRDSDTPSTLFIAEQPPPSEQEDVLVFLLLWRLMNVGTDLLISLNVPLSAVMEAAAPTHGDFISLAENMPSVSSILSATAGDLSATRNFKTDFLASVDAMKVFLQQFRIVDWSLFSP